MDTIIYFFLLVLGSIIGSFLNVLIDRLPHGETIGGRSHCDSCKRHLTWKELVPFFSFLAMKGKSSCCKKQLSFYYPVVEVVTGVSFILVWTYVEPYMYSQTLPDIFQNALGLEVSSTFSLLVAAVPVLWTLFLTLSILLVCCFIVMFFADVKYYIIPDSMQFGAFLITFFVYLVIQIPLSLFIYKLISAVLVMLPILLLFLGTKGKGMGFADVKFAGFMGFLLGLYSGFWALYIAFISGAVISVIALVLKKKNVKSRIPFGPFLIIGTLVLFFAPELVYDTISVVFGYPIR